MSHLASIDIKYSQKPQISIIVNQLLENSWNCNDYGKLTYLDNDDYDWKNESLIHEKTIISLLDKRNQDNHIVGICLLHQTSLGGQFLFLPDNETISILLNINRLKIPNSSFTDFTHYIKLLKPILNDCPYIICEDCT